MTRALSLNAKVLLLDEPTATLSRIRRRTAVRAAETSSARDGIAMVYISHRLREVLEITNRIVCLRDGERVAELPTSEATHDKLVEMLAGASSTRHDEPPAPRPRWCCRCAASASVPATPRSRRS